MRIEAKLESLRARLRELERVVVAFSGGVDSAFLLAVTHKELGQNCVAVVGVSPSLLPEELDGAREVAREIGAPLREVETHEIEDPNYAANPNNRCYFCKSELWSVLTNLAASENLGVVCDGTNTDDEQEWRPGTRAGSEKEIRSPLREVGLSKAEIRSLSLQIGLPTWDKPAMPCLASRIPYGQSVTREALHRVGRAEVWLREQGFREIRVRHFLENERPQARLEIAPNELPRIFPIYDVAAQKLREFGFESVLLDLEGYRRGKMNDVVVQEPLASPSAQKPLARLL